MELVGGGSVIIGAYPIQFFKQSGEAYQWRVVINGAYPVQFYNKYPTNRPGVAGAVLQIALSLTDSLNHLFPPNLIVYITRLLRLNRCHLCKKKMARKTQKKIWAFFSFIFRRNFFLKSGHFYKTFCLGGKLLLLIHSHFNLVM